MPPPDEAEAQLIARLVRRDERAFNELVSAHQGRVFGLVLRMLGDRAEAEDVAQEVFVQVFKAIGSFRGESKLSTWIFRIAVNLCKNRSQYLRARNAGRLAPAPGDGSEAAAPAAGASVGRVARPDEVLTGKQVEQAVRDALAELEPSFRECLVLRDLEDLSYEEIEKITGLPEGTVKSRIHRARAQLRQLVERALGEKIG